jgi:hypothetical protein
MLGIRGIEETTFFWNRRIPRQQPSNYFTLSRHPTGFRPVGGSRRPRNRTAQETESEDREAEHGLESWRTNFTWDDPTDRVQGSRLYEPRVTKSVTVTVKSICDITTKLLSLIWYFIGKLSTQVHTQGLLSPPHNKVSARAQKTKFYFLHFVLGTFGNWRVDNLKISDTGFRSLKYFYAHGRQALSERVFKEPWLSIFVE